MPVPMVRLERAGKRIGESWVWRDLDVEAHPGRMTAVTGASGSGKSTLLEVLGLLAPIDEGRLEIAGRDVTRSRPSIRRRHFRETVAFLFQDFGLVEGWTASRNVSMGAIHSSRIGRERRAAVASALERFGIDDLAAIPVNRLSGGQQQRVALARVHVKRPALILADEPTSALDPANARVVTDALREYANRGATVVLSTHNQNLASQCDSLIAL